MPAVFVHGVPETTELWGPLVAELDRTDVVLLGLPGFGSEARGFVGHGRRGIAGDFEWHDLAKLWISPVGDAFMAGTVGAPAEDLAALRAGAGVPEAGALAMAGTFDETIAACILALPLVDGPG